MNPFLKNYDTDKGDDELIIASNKGDKKALESLLKKHQPYIYNIAWKMAQNPDDAADLTQEALVKITINLSKFKFNSTFRTWAYRIVVNHFLDTVKKKSGPFESFESYGENLDRVPNIDLNETEQKENKEVIREMNLTCMSGMLLCFNSEQRMIYIIGEMFGANHTIGAEIMNMSKDNFRAKLSKTRKDLHNFMNKKCGLINKDNPCRCHKKVSVAVESGHINAKKLLQNRKEYSLFRNEIKDDADYMFDYVDDKYGELFKNMTYKKDFDKKIFIEQILDDIDVRKKLNLN